MKGSVLRNVDVLPASNVWRSAKQTMTKRVGVGGTGAGVLVVAECCRGAGNFVSRSRDREKRARTDTSLFMKRSPRCVKP